MKKRTLLLTALSLVLLSGCADVETINNCVNNDPSGFWYGIWHGIITPFSFICSLFMDEVAIYAVNNTGGWYDFGFLLGVGGLGWGTSKSS